MAYSDANAGQAVRRVMLARDPHEEERASTPLELFFDLCFVVAIAQAAAQLHHAIAEDHISSGLLSYALVFFAIWWAWINFTWFASAYDTNDVLYRIATFGQVTGALILAAGIERGFVDHEFGIVFAGYVVMRLGLASQRLRAARDDRDRRATMLRYATGENGLLIGWAVVIFTLPEPWLIAGWLVLAAAELLVPAWAEHAATTTWHPHHIAERFGLFTIIVLGESVLAATDAVRTGFSEETGRGDLVVVVAGGLLVIFSMWWIYFAKPAYRFLTSNRQAFIWGYGHYFVYASGAAVGAGLAVMVDYVTHHAATSGTIASAAITVPVALFLCVLWVLHIRPHQAGPAHTLLFPVAALLILASTIIPAPWPILLTGLIMTVLVIIGTMTVTDSR